MFEARASVFAANTKWKCNDSYLRKKEKKKKLLGEQVKCIFKIIFKYAYCVSPLHLTWKMILLIAISSPTEVIAHNVMQRPIHLGVVCSICVASLSPRDWEERAAAPRKHVQTDSRKGWKMFQVCFLQMVRKIGTEWKEGGGGEVCFERKKR